MKRIRDIALAQKVQLVLDQNQHLCSLPIKVRASNGTIYLSGRVDTIEHKREAEMIAGGAIGVRKVVSRLVSDSDSPMLS